MINKRIALSLMSIVVALAVVSATAFAQFSATQSNNGNTFSTETLTFQLDGTDNLGSEVNGPFFTATGMMPGGDLKTAYVEVKNTSNSDMLFRAYATNISQSIGGLAGELLVTVTINPSGYTPVLAGNLYGPQDTVIYTGTLSGLNGPSNALDNLNAAFNQDFPLAPNGLAVYKIDVQLDFDAGNQYQGQNLTADLRVDATQFEGQTDINNVSW